MLEYRDFLIGVLCSFGFVNSYVWCRPTSKHLSMQKHRQ
jgi:hypothetical protein